MSRQLVQVSAFFLAGANKVFPAARGALCSQIKSLKDSKNSPAEPATGTVPTCYNTPARQISSSHHATHVAPFRVHTASSYAAMYAHTDLYRQREKKEASQRADPTEGSEEQDETDKTARQGGTGPRAACDLLALTAK